jgi:hypothetical protein
VHASRVEYLDPARNRRQGILGDQGVRAVRLLVDEQVRPERREFPLLLLRRSNPHLHQAGAAVLQRKSYDLTIHQGPEGDQHAYHAY